MDRSSRRRIWKVEKLLSAAQKENEKKQKEEYEIYLLHARLHATAVAAIALSGEPKIDEPLSTAWMRALRYHGIQWTNVGGAERINDQVGASQRLVRVILGGKKELERFTEIFRTALIWLLDFTGTFFDASFLHFKLPHKSWRPKWGSAGYEESRGWPLLPLGTMVDGDPVADEHARLWPLPLNMMKKADRIPDFEDNLSQEDENNLSPEADLVEDMALALGLAEGPENEKELSRYEKHRLQALLANLSRSKK